MRSYTSLEPSFGFGSPILQTVRQYSFGYQNRISSDSKDDKKSTMFVNNNSPNSQNTMQHKASFQNLLFSDTSFPHNRGIQSLVEHHAHVSELYRKDLAESYKGVAELKQENFYLKEKMKHMAEQKLKVAEVIDEKKKEKSEITQNFEHQIQQLKNEVEQLQMQLEVERERIKEMRNFNGQVLVQYAFTGNHQELSNNQRQKQIELIDELSRVRTENRLNNQLAARYKKDYENILSSYKFIEGSFQKKEKKKRSDDTFTILQVKPKDSNDKTDYLFSFEDKAEVRSRVVSEGFQEEPKNQRKGSNRWNKQEFKLTSIKSLVKLNEDNNSIKHSVVRNNQTDNENKIKNLEEQLNKLRVKLNEEMNKNIDLQKKLRSIEAEEKAYQIIIAEKGHNQEQLERLRSQLECSKSQLEENSQQMKKQEEKINKVKDSNEMLTNITVDFNKALIILEAENRKLFKENKELQKEINRLKGIPDPESQIKVEQQEINPDTGEIKINLHEAGKDSKWKVSRMTKRERIATPEKQQTAEASFNYFSRSSAEFTNVQNYEFTPQ